MQQFAYTKKGKCLSIIYKGCHFKLKWECHMGHIWAAPYVEVSQGSWCPKCARENRKGTIEEMQEIAKQKRGECLSTKYVKSSVRLEWQCSEGHKWMATPNSIKRGSWCKVCWFEKGIKGVNRKHSIDEAIVFAKRKGGNCLSTEYINSQRPLRWICKYGHIWITNFNAVVNSGTWCPECAGHKKHNIGVAQRLAKERGGECLSQNYNRNKEKLLWRCANGHEWLARFDNVKNKTWCPKCPKYFNEEKCRYVFENLLNYPFIKTKQPLSGNYELDGYCQVLKLAFEYHGVQHYKINKRRSAKVAQERLQIILSHERAEGGNIDFLPRLRHELLAVIEKYVKVDQDQVNVQLQRTENYSVLELNITFLAPTENLKMIHK